MLNIIHKLVLVLSYVVFIFSPVSVATAQSNVTIKVSHISPTELFSTGKANDLLWRDTCDNWVLTAGQIEQFFKLSREYQEHEFTEYSNTFDWAHCSIPGSLWAEGERWSFEINASGAAEWHNGNSVRVWGCTKAECQQFLIPDYAKPYMPPKPDIRIIDIYASEYDKRFDLFEGADETPETDITYCQSWGLTKEQALKFFQSSDEYLENRSQRFYWLPCNVSGILESEGRIWQFTINQAATAIWRDGETVRLWECSSDDCRLLNLLIPVEGLEQTIEK